MNECREIRELLPWYAKESLPADEAHNVAEHLMRCAACRDELATTMLLGVELGEVFGRMPGVSEEAREAVAEETYGKNLASLDVGSFILGFSLGASVRHRSVPIRGDLRLMGRRIPLFSTGKGGRK